MGMNAGILFNASDSVTGHMSGYLTALSVFSVRSPLRRREHLPPRNLVWKNPCLTLFLIESIFRDGLREFPRASEKKTKIKSTGE
ncbi:hypothetical protein KOR42_26220 [Thalassoglobus neptunius]|uniref:Uncharacterized protein n=1 Tax=Thalassoglobus neptunius TaxID=1938619 RepID=A0A5C5X0K2_9PLAN|nr:hypothetical protein KOR42_26220 [Thalassoglobus neptunius]